MLRLKCISIAAAIAAACTGTAVFAETPDMDMDDLAPGSTADFDEQNMGSTEIQPIPSELPTENRLSDAELGEQRGTFAIGGLEIRLGAEMMTYHNGDLIMYTTVNWTDTGIETSRQVAQGLKIADPAALQAGLAGGVNAQFLVGGTPVYLTNEGQTLLLQRADGALQNVLVNTANNQNFMQVTNATVDIAGYQGFQSDLLNSRLSGALESSLGAMTAGALGF
jgi:hypothetical protein